MKQTIIGIVVLVLVVLGGWWAYSSGALKGIGSPTATSTSQTVATVNGQAITRAQLTTAEQQLAAQAGVSISSLDASTTAALQAQALDSLIGQQLVLEAAQQAGYTASSTAVDAQLAQVKSQFSNDADYQKALTQQNMTEAGLKNQITQSIIVQAYLEATLHLSQITASQSEIQSAYDQLKAASQSTTTPALAQVQDQVKQLVINQKQQQQVAQLVQQLRAQADVKILI